MSDAVDPETLRALGRLAGLNIPEQDLATLVAAMRQHLASIAALEHIDLTDIESPLTFTADWDE